LAERSVKVGVPVVVVEPESHVVVPPVANADPFRGCEPPPVLPPVHPLITMVEEILPLIPVQVIFPPAAPAVPARPTVSADTGSTTAASNNKVRRIHNPFVCPMGTVRTVPPGETVIRNPSVCLVFDGASVR
jgi:hypothetical protein